jgi:hypothetical protein
MARRHESDARQRRNVERIRIVAIHQVTGPTQPDQVLQRHANSIPQRQALASRINARAQDRPSEVLTSQLKRSVTAAMDIAICGWSILAALRQRRICDWDAM